MMSLPPAEQAPKASPGQGVHHGVVFLRDSVSLLQVEEAVKIVHDHGLRLVRDVKPGDEKDVVAIVVGLGRFDLSDAQRFPNLRTVARFGAGVDNVDVKGLWQARRLTVSCTSNLSNRDVAEFALAMIILALRGAPRDISALGAETSTWRVIGRGLGLSEAVVGIVGCGNIGVETAGLVAPLASKTLLWNRSRRPVSLCGVNDDRYARVDDLDELAVRADVVTVHLALNRETGSFVGASFFDKVKSARRSIAVVNTSRGNVVDESALLQALNDGVVGTAAVDVWSTEGQHANDVVRALRRHPGVLPTSHIGSHTTGSLRRYAMQCARNITALVNGRPSDVAAYVVDPSAL
jgi:D-3-phosphoglycerate dehydrogenase / 2-oxoglutarate reductase